MQSRIAEGKAAVTPEYVRVDLRRADGSPVADTDGIDVLIDGAPNGKVGQLLQITSGTWTVGADVEGVVAREVEVYDTSVRRPLVVEFDVP